MRAILIGNLHVWDKKGNHMGWRTPTEFSKHMSDFVGYSIPKQTASNWLKKERKLYEDGQGMRCQGDLKQMQRETELAREEMKQLREGKEPACLHQGRPFTFLPAWYDELAKKCTDILDDVMGFGPHMVGAFATEIYRKQMAVSEGEAWQPSYEWCLWFMVKKLKLVPRRTSGSRVQPDAQEKQEALHKLTVQRIAVHLSEGLNPKYIIGADEFGSHLFPQETWRWSKKGSTNVTSAVKEDKRQYTGDIAHNGAGQIVAVHQIFAGKTTASLPSLHIREQDRYSESHLNFQFAFTPNHWANHESKLAFVKKIWQWVEKEWAKDIANGNAEEGSKPKCVLLQDCW
jgi:hypothetical protein